MKTLVTLFFIMLGTAAFAHNGDNTIETTAVKTTAVKVAKKEKDTVRATHANENAVKATTQRTNCTSCTGLEARFDLGSYFAEFVNRSNLKLVKLILTE